MIWAAKIWLHNILIHKITSFWSLMKVGSLYDDGVLHFLKIPENEEHVWQQMSDAIKSTRSGHLCCFKTLGCSLMYEDYPETLSTSIRFNDWKLEECKSRLPEQISGFPRNFWVAQKFVTQSVRLLWPE